MSGDAARLISVARGQQPADLLLKNARVVNTFTGEVEEGNIAVCGERVAGVGDYSEAGEVIDLEGRWVAPGLINGHTHLESSMLDVGQYARAVVPHGTSAIVTDLHEIANVAGMGGMRYVRDYARRLPLELFVMAPSCVPATHLETSGAVINPEDIRDILRWKECIGLGEVMNFPGVINADETVLHKIAISGNGVIDGHAPGLSGKDLTAYIAAGIGSDHESVTLAEAREKLRQGMHVMIREGSSEKNLETLLPLVTDKTYRRAFFVVDDRSCADLLHDGDIDAVVRKAIHLGLEPVRAIQMATINTAAYFRLQGLGAVAPGYLANLLVLDSLEELKIDIVFYRGRMAARGGKPLFTFREPGGHPLRDTVQLKPFSRDDLRLKATGEIIPVIEVVPGQIITRYRKEKARIADGMVLPDVSRDILKLVVLERHWASGKIGVGMVRGFGLKQGALASSVAHDSHNIVATGTGDEDIAVAVKEIERQHGGLAVVKDGKVAGSLPLPIAGLLSAEPLEAVASQLEKLERLVREMGCPLAAPFAALSFMALPVIPELRLTDLGLVDVNRFQLINR